MGPIYHAGAKLSKSLGDMREDVDQLFCRGGREKAHDPLRFSKAAHLDSAGIQRRLQIEGSGA